MSARFSPEQPGVFIEGYRFRAVEPYLLPKVSGYIYSDVLYIWNDHAMNFNFDCAPLQPTFADYA